MHIKLGQEPYLNLINKIDDSLKSDYIKAMYSKVLEKQELSLTVQGNPNLQAGYK